MCNIKENHSKIAIFYKCIRLFVTFGIISMYLILCQQLHPGKQRAFAALWMGDRSRIPPYM